MIREGGQDPPGGGKGAGPPLVIREGGQDPPGGREGGRAPSGD